MNIWIPIWFIFWIGVLGIPNYLFKKYKITFYKYPWQHVIFYTVALIALFFVYQEPLLYYFQNISLIFFFILFGILLLWLLVPKCYQKDYFNKKERLHYQIPKFFDVVFQQCGFLAGLLTFGVSPIYFGLIFFLTHLPLVFFIPKKYAFVFSFGSLFGGIAFSLLHIQGVYGFLFALFLHLFFYAGFHYILSRKRLLGETPHKR